MSQRPRPEQGLMAKKLWIGGTALFGAVAAAMVAAYLVVASGGEDPNLATTAPELPTTVAGVTRTPTATAAASTAVANQAIAATPTAAVQAAGAAPAAATATTAPASAPQPTATPAASAAGKFIIDPAQSSSKFVITRTVLGSTASVVATGSGVSGQFFVSEDGLSNAGASSFQLDMRTVRSNDSLTNSFLQSGAIDTTNYPFAQFVASSTSPFSPGYGTGNQFSFTLSGTLTLNGVARPVSLQVLAKQSGDFFSATGDADILLSQFDVQVPDTILGGARDQVHVQVLLVAHT